MAEKKFRGAPFGTQTARFDVSGVHPNSKTPSTFTQTPYCRKSTSDLNTSLGPGRYDVDYGGFSSKSVDERASGPGWARAYQVTRMASLPHLLHKEQWNQRRLRAKKLGPGTYDIKDFLEMNEEKPRSTHGIIQTREARFKAVIKNENTPGPGTYGEGGVPHAAKEAKQRQSASTVGLLDAGSPTRSLPFVGSQLGPGRYETQSFTDEMKQKVTSLRGPYDLFTGDRNKPLKTGHFAAPSHANLGPGQYEIKSFLDEYSGQHKKHHGHFGKIHEVEGKPTERIYSFTLSQNPRVPEHPGPGSYDPKDIQSKPPSQAQKSPGFLSSSQRNDRMATKFFTGNFNPVGPGRYDIQKRENLQYQNGHSSVFKSKTLRPDAKREKFLQERIRAKDVPLGDRVFLVAPDHPGYYARSHTVIKPNQQSHYTSQRTITVV